jgi:SAM-dependent methyltransferase
MIQPLARAVCRVLTFKMRRGPHLTRYVMYRRLAALHADRAPHERALSISHSENLCHALGYAATQVTSANYPEVSIFKLPFPDATFDCVCSDQVLEHVEGSPFDAVAETLRVLKPGGLLLHTTCLLMYIHGYPSDFWRFTPDALRLLVTHHGGDVIEADGWGNPFVPTMMSLGLQFVPIPHAKWHPLHWVATFNHPDWPVSTWVFARKHAALNS